MTNGQGELQTLRLEVDTETKVAVVTLDRPPVNAIRIQMQIELRDTFTVFASRRDVNRVVAYPRRRPRLLRRSRPARPCRPRGGGARPGKLWPEARAGVEGRNGFRVSQVVAELLGP